MECLQLYHCLYRLCPGGSSRNPQKPAVLAGIALALRERMMLRSLLLASLTIGCTAGAIQPGTPGENGRATFEYAYCLFDCGLDQAMMHGTEESIAVRAATIPDVTISSTAPQVVTVQSSVAARSCCTTTSDSCRSIQAGETCNANETTLASIDAVATAPGNAELVLTQGDGTVFERIAIAVAEPASLDFGSPMPMSIGTSYAVAWTARDASGAKLMSTSGVHVKTSDASVVDFQRTLLSSNATEVDAENVLFGTTMEPHATGAATITATAQNVTTTFPVSVK
jgi:hypothetical protein